MNSPATRPRPVRLIAVLLAYEPTLDVARLVLDAGPAEVNVSTQDSAVDV
jgi:hypothetical protein